MSSISRHLILGIVYIAVIVQQLDAGQFKLCIDDYHRVFPLLLAALPSSLAPNNDSQTTSTRTCSDGVSSPLLEGESRELP